MRLLLRFPGADEVERQVFDPQERAAVPDLVNAEVIQAVRRSERSGVISSGEAEFAIEQLGYVPVLRYPTATQLDRAWALRHNFSAYDAMYVALAEALETPLVTADARLALAVRSHSLARPILLAG